jgi:hypothetical protein
MEYVSFLHGSDFIAKIPICIHSSMVSVIDIGEDG